MRAVGVWRIIPRIRTGLKPLDHQISHHRGWTPSYRAQASLRLHNLPLPAVGEIPGTGGKTDKTTTRTFDLRTCQICQPAKYGVWTEKNLWDQQPEMPETNWVASCWTQEAACLRQLHGTACPVFGAVTASACAFLVRFQCSREKFNAWMSAALLWKQEHYPYYSRTFKIFILAPRICHRLWPSST